MLLRSESRWKRNLFPFGSPFPRQHRLHVCHRVGLLKTILQKKRKVFHSQPHRQEFHLSSSRTSIKTLVALSRVTLLWVSRSFHLGTQ